MVDLVNPVMGAQNMMLQGAMGAQQKQQQAQYSNALLGAYGGQTPQSFEGMNPEQIQQIQSALAQFSEGQKAATLERINLLDYAANNANEQNYPMIAQAVARAMPELQGQIPQDFQTFVQMKPQILAQVGATRSMLGQSQGPQVLTSNQVVDGSVVTMTPEGPRATPVMGMRPSSESVGLENVDTDQYTLQSVQAYQNSVARGNPDVTLLQPREPTMEGYRPVRTETGEVRGWVPLPGTEDYREVQNQIRADRENGNMARRQAQNVVEVVDRSINSLEGSDAAAGFVGNLLSRVPGTNTFSLGEDIDTIKANLGFDRLQQMRDASPTGGALGQVSERELAQLERTVRSLAIAQPKERLIENLRTVRDQYQAILSQIRPTVTMEQFLGIEEAPSASRFQIEVVE